MKILHWCLYLIILPFLCGIIVGMSTETWGLMPKSGVDTETIEEAIVRLIAVHNDDNTAHLLVGQSIDEHRKETILDHPAGSVLPDKSSFNDLTFSTRFETLTAFTKTGVVNASSWPGVNIELFDGGGDTASIKANFLALLTGSTATYDILMDSYFYRDSVSDVWDIRGGIANNALTTHYLGFRIVGGEVRGYARINGTYTETADLFTVPQGQVVFVRVFYNYAEGTIYFYVNGLQLGTLDATAGLNISNQIAFYGNAGTEESCVFRLYSFKFARSL